MHETIFTRFAPAPVGPYSQAVLANGVLYGAGQIGLDPVSSALVSSDTAVQAEQVLRNIEAVLSAAGASMRDVVRVTVYLVDLSEFAAVGVVYARYFPDRPPARTTVQVAALPLGGRVEMDFTAVLP
ncbi:MAG: RidA family protein [Clostridiaceae bacterium]|jgi:2-iminobutanoate/2-iminopropanoate deaminase|nr:RidA family protein [Clostridiaceae bacterium]